MGHKGNRVFPSLSLPTVLSLSHHPWNFLHLPWNLAGFPPSLRFPLRFSLNPWLRSVDFRSLAGSGRFQSRRSRIRSVFHSGFAVPHSGSRSGSLTPLAGRFRPLRLRLVLGGSVWFAPFPVRLPLVQPCLIGIERKEMEIDKMQKWGKYDSENRI